MFVGIVFSLAVRKFFVRINLYRFLLCVFTELIFFLTLKLSVYIKILLIISGIFCYKIKFILHAEQFFVRPAN